MTPITKQSLEKLKEKARAATPGKRRWVDRYDFHEHKEHREQGLEADCENIGAGRIKLVAGKDTILEEWAEYAADSGISMDLSDAKFFEAASPDMVLDLIARVNGMQSALERITANPNEHAAYYMLAEASTALESFGVK